MDCHDVQHRLLESEDPRAESCASAEVARHLQECADCRMLASRLTALEATWRSLPIPLESQRAKEEFLARLPAWEALDATVAVPLAARPSGRQLSRRRWLKWSLATAAGVSAVGVGISMFVGGNEARASEALFGELVDWNLRLTQADSAAARDQLYAEHAAPLRSRIAGTRLSDQQAALAQAFLENGAWMARHRDPVTEATLFDGVAQRLLDLSQNAGEKGSFRHMDRWIEQYNRVIESGVNPNVELAERSGALDFEHQRKLERLVLSDAEHLQKLAALLAIAPNASRKEIHRAMKLLGKRTKTSRTKKSHGGDTAT
jgi:hypothetical protein